MEDGREGRRAEVARVVSNEAVVQPLASVERWTESARLRDVERPLRKEEAD